ncbi:MAG: flavoprotein [Candidatus Omnitrophota bacterium]
MEKKNILLGVTASIAAYKACDLISDLREAGYAVTVAMTRDAHHFITPLSLQSFAGTPVVDDFFSLPGRTKPVHIELAKNADLILIAPASADVLAKLAHGFAEDVLCCTVLASQAPLVIAPAMNEKMYFNRFTQENIERLKKHGAIFVPPIEGHLVCMDQGMGHLAENATIVKVVEKVLSSK